MKKNKFENIADNQSKIVDILVKNISNKEDVEKIIKLLNKSLDMAYKIGWGYNTNKTIAIQGK
jgi:hypothetical protein